MMVRRLGYAAFFMASFLVSIYLTFPWPKVKEQVVLRASQGLGQTVSIGKLQPSWLTGVRLSDVSIKQKGDEVPLEFEWIFARGSLFSFLGGGYGGTFELPLGGGLVEGSVSGGNEALAVEGEVSKVELALVPRLRSAVGLALSGELGLNVDLRLNLKDPKQNAGNIRIKVSGLETLKAEDVKYPIPATEIGDLDWTIPIEAGKVLFRNQRLEGPAASVILNGEMVMAAQPARSMLNLMVRFKPNPELLRKEPALPLLLNNIRRAKGSDGYYGYQISGTMKRPRFSPKRS